MTHYIFVFLYGLVCGFLLCSLAYWRGIKEGRRRAREAFEKELKTFAGELSKAVAPVEEAKGEQKGP